MTRLKVETTQLRDKLNAIEQLLVTLTGTCAPPCCPFSSGEDLSMSPPPTFVQ